MKLASLVAALLIACMPAPAFAAWKLDAAQSSLGFATVKNGAVGEGHRFTALDGGVDAHGTATLSVTLASVDTGIAIRDERMREMLFEVANFPNAEVRASVPLATIERLPVGGAQVVPLDLQLSVHGPTVNIGTEVRVQRVARDRVLVTSVKPVVVNAESLGLAEGVEKLRAIAGLQAISPAVPVSIVLEFVRK